MSSVTVATPSTTASRSQPHSYAGVGALSRFIARRDRVRAPVWVLATVGVVVAGSGSVVGLYRTPEELATYADVALADPAIQAMTGPGYGLDDPTSGAVVMNEMSMFTLIGVALVVVFMVVRHTRAEEETDRAELVRAAPVGRHATLVATIVWVSTIAAAMASGIALGLMIWLPVAGSIAFAAAVLGLALVSIGVAAVSAQVASTSRAASSFAGAALGAAYLVRAVGDLGDQWLTWLSPIGWAQGIRAYADERWWVLIPLAVTAALLIAGSIALSARRDLGHGLVEARSGPARASRRLASPLALAVRLQRVTVVGWVVGIATMGFFMGLMADQADELAENEAILEIMAQAGGGSITESFLATIMLSVALLTSGFVVSSALRLRGEERALRVAPLLATPVSRRRWLWSHPLVAVGGGGMIVFAGGVLTALGYAAGIGAFDETWSLLAAAVVWLPALFVLIGLVVFLVGVVPRWSLAAWVAVVYVAVVGFLGETLDLPQVMQDLSPFEHVPQLPAADFEIVPTLALLAVAVALALAGTVGMRRRDVA